MSAFDLHSDWTSSSHRAPHATSYELLDPRQPIPGVGKEARTLHRLHCEIVEACSGTIVPAGPSWLDDVYAFVAVSNPDAAIDVLFDHVNELLFEGQAARCNDLFRVIDLDRLDTNLLVALLSITAPAREQLPDRVWLAQRVEVRLARLAPERVGKLMSGLR